MLNVVTEGDEPEEKTDADESGRRGQVEAEWEGDATLVDARPPEDNPPETTKPR
jgi:hypothetical protein